MAYNSYHRWTKAEEVWLKKHWACMHNQDIADYIGVTMSAAKKKARSFGLQKAPEWLRYICRFPNAGMYQKESRPKNTLFDGAVTVRTNHKTGKISKWIRTGSNQWQPLAIYNWLKAGHTIPEGYVLRFKNGNPADCEISNLETVPRGKHFSMNRKIGKEKKESTPDSLSKRELRKIKTKERLAKMQQASLERRNQKKLLTAERRKLSHEADKLKKAEDRQRRRAEKEAEKNRLKVQKRQARIDRQWQVQAKENKKKVTVFKIKQVDYTQLIPVRIDPKTVIYAKPGQNIEDLKAKYFKLHSKKIAS